MSPRRLGSRLESARASRRRHAAPAGAPGSGDPRRRANPRTGVPLATGAEHARRQPHLRVRPLEVLGWKGGGTNTVHQFAASCVQ